MNQVSIIMRTKNRPQFLARAVDSVCAQTWTNWTLIIVNDGGDPAPVDRIVQASAARLRGRVEVVHNPRSLGMEAASNAGIARAAGDYLVIHDDDDSWLPDFLRAGVRYLEAAGPAVGGVLTGWEHVSEDDAGQRYAMTVSAPRDAFLTLYDIALPNRNFPPIAFLYRRAVVAATGPYREDLPVLGDWEFNLRFLQVSAIGVVAAPLARYHVRPRCRDPQAGNSVVVGDASHKETYARLRSELLRQDLAAGRFGVGNIVNLLHRQTAQFDETVSLIWRSAPFGLGLSRLKRQWVAKARAVLASLRPRRGAGRLAGPAAARVLS